MKTVCLMAALAANVAMAYAQTPEVTLDHDLADGKAVDVFTVTNHAETPVAAYMFQVEYQNATTGKLEHRAHWFDSLLFQVQSRSLQPNETQTVELSHLTGDTIVAAQLLGVVFADGRTQGDGNVINAFAKARRVVVEEIPYAIAVIEDAVSQGSLPSLAARLENLGMGSALTDESTTEAGASETTELYYRSVKSRAGREAANY